MSMFYSFISFFFSFLITEIKERTFGVKPTVIQLIDNDRIRSTQLFWDELDYLGRTPDWKESSPKVFGDTLKWTINTNEPFKIDGEKILERSFPNFFEPGDSISIAIRNNELTFSGRGSEKLKVFEDIRTAIEDFKRPSRLLSNEESLENYLAWNNYVKKRRDRAETLLEENRGALSAYAFERIRTTIIAGIEYDLIIKFFLLFDQRERVDLSAADFISIFDSTINKPSNKWLQVSQTANTHVNYLYELAFLSVLRDTNFEIPEALRIKDFDYTTNRCRLMYDKAQQLYTGNIRDEVLRYIMTKQGIRDASMHPVFEEMLKTYYNAINDPEGKAFIKKFEKEELTRNLKIGRVPPYFSLTGSEGDSYSIRNAAGKTVLLYFWESNNENCRKATGLVNKVVERYLKDTGFVVIAVSLDKDKDQWLESLHANEGIITGAKQLYTNGSGLLHPVVKGYQLDTLPALFVVNSDNKLIRSPVNNVLSDQAEDLRRTLDKQYAEASDGPYVIYGKDVISSYNLHAGKVEQKNMGPLKKERLFAKTDVSDVNLEVKMKDHIHIEPSEYPRADKLFILSDVEGNFEAFRKLLQANKVIDENYNWIFGNGHLVFAGDMFDRGRQVTECLWLIYMLEEKAKQAGGYVHFILGNHEMMNLNEDFRYVNKKYIANADKMHFSYAQLYNENSELGKWLRTKNIVEKIGDNLFIHGGISNEIISMDSNIQELNGIARKYYSKADEARKSTDPAVSAIFGFNSSPFWYRGYYNKDEKKEEQAAIIDRVLKRYAVNRIITGHTVVSERISSHWGGKVINTDTKHAEGFSAGLLIEGNTLYSAGMDGEKRSLEIF